MSRKVLTLAVILGTSVAWCSRAADLTMIFEGLVEIEHRTLADGTPVLWALMVDATKAKVKVPPCVDMSNEAHYPAHEAAIFVQGASVSEGGNPINALIPLNDYDVTVTTGKKGFGSVTLQLLVSEEELKQAWGSGSAAISVDPGYYTTPIAVNPNDPLIARIRLDGGDTVEARANVCEKRQVLPPHRQRHFRFEDDPADHDGRCNKAAADGISAVQLGEDVLVTQANITSVTLTLSNDKITPRTILITPTGPTFKIAFRNTMPDYHQLTIDGCTGAAAEHYSSYRWYYRLENSPGARCNVAPCRACPASDPIFDCSAAGFKCPIP